MRVVILLISSCIGFALGGKCPAETGFYPHETDCDKYYQCENGVAKEGLCADGLAFNTKSAPLYLRCDSLLQVDCSNRPQLQKPFGSEKCPRRNGLFPDKDDCRGYWNCVDGIGTRVSCPEGLVYNPKAGNCDWPDAVEECNVEKILGFKCPEDPTATRGVYVYYPHPDDCRKHYACVKVGSTKAFPRLLTCHYGLVYDIETKRCDFPDKVEGCEDYYPKPSSTTAAPKKKEKTEQTSKPHVEQ